MLEEDEEKLDSILSPALSILVSMSSMPDELSELPSSCASYSEELLLARSLSLTGIVVPTPDELSCWPVSP